VDQEVLAFMTTEPNELTVKINHERMPVLLSDPADFETWLSGSTDEAFKLARSYAADRMRIVHSGSERKDLLEPEADRFRSNEKGLRNRKPEA
jgi:putative SOS response-associated peptidase YedK